MTQKQRDTDLDIFDEYAARVQQFVAPTLQIRVTDGKSANTAIEAAQEVKRYSKDLEMKRKELVGPLNERVREINATIKRIEAPLERAGNHIQGQLAIYERELERGRQAKLAEERRLREEEERKAAAERARIEAEIEAKWKSEIEALKGKSETVSRAASLFGTSSPAPDLAAERRRIDEEAERERLERDARLERERLERETAAKERAWDIEQEGIKNARKVWKCEALDLSLVPKDFLKIELNSAAVLAAARAAAARGEVLSIPGVRLWQDTTVPIGAQTRVPDLLLAAEEKGS